MERGYVWQGQYGRRTHLQKVFEELLEQQSATVLEMLAIFVNNNPYNLEFYVAVFYKNPKESDIEKMKVMFENAGLKYRNDLTARELLLEMGNRRFDSRTFCDASDVQIGFQSMFCFAEVSELENKGYYMKPYGKEKQVFISHSSHDKAEVEKLIPILNGQDLPVWFDKYSIGIGESITEEVQKGIDSSAVVIMWITQDFLESKWCRFEMNAFIKKLVEDDCKILSVVDKKIKPEQLPIFLRDIKYIIRENESVFEVAEKLIKSLGYLKST